MIMSETIMHRNELIIGLEWDRVFRRENSTKAELILPWQNNFVYTWCGGSNGKDKVSAGRFDAVANVCTDFVIQSYHQGRKSA